MAHIYNTSLSLTPVEIDKEATDCSNSGSWKSFDFALHLFLSGKNAVEWKDLNGLIIQNQNTVRDTEWSESIEYVFHRNNLTIKQLRKPKDVNLCPDQLVYSKNTIESAALNASYYIKKTERAFSEATQVALRPVTVKIAPKISQTFISGVTSQTYYLTDNAFYQPENKTITFLPHSYEARSAGFKQSYWEIPIVPSHEYGHHIFNSLFPYFSLKRRNIELCYDNRASMEVSGYGVQPRKVTVEEVVHAFNEGFSDLIAFYSLEDSELDLKSVKCLELSRDVSSGIFYNGKSKIMSEDALKTFFADVKMNIGISCEQVDYQDVHTIGAIFAHNADRFLSRFTDSNELKLKVLHSWVVTLKNKHNQLSSLSPERYFEEVFQLFLRLSLEKFDRKFDRSSCNEVNRFYPNLVNRLVECL